MATINLNDLRSTSSEGDVTTVTDTELTNIHGGSLVGEAVKIIVLLIRIVSNPGTPNT